MEAGEVVCMRRVRCHMHGDKAGWAEFTAQKKGRKYTASLLYMFLGCLPFSKPFEDKDVEERLGVLGWKKMTKAEHRAFLKKLDKKKAAKTTKKPPKKSTR